MWPVERLDKYFQNKMDVAVEKLITEMAGQTHKKNIVETQKSLNLHSKN